MMKLVYLAWGKSSVFDSQVLALIHFMKSASTIENVILIFGYRNRKELKWIEKKDLKGISLITHRYYPNYFLFNLLNEISLYYALKKLPPIDENFIFHSRGEFIPFHLRKFFKSHNISKDRILIDIRGASIEETSDFSNKHSLLNKLKINQKKNILHYVRDFKNISVVSEYLREYLSQSFRFNDSLIMINSCISNQTFKYSNEKRILIREQLGIQNTRIVIVFISGGKAFWQNNEIINELAEKGFVILNLSPVVISHPNVINKFIDYGDVPSYLSASDFGFIWRDKSIVNYVASPVKFSEYVASGLPVITNGNVPLINDFIIKYNAGVIVESLSDITYELLWQHLIEDREKMSKIGYSIFGVENICNKYLNTYQKMTYSK